MFCRTAESRLRELRQNCTQTSSSYDSILAAKVKTRISVRFFCCLEDQFIRPGNFADISHRILREEFQKSLTPVDLRRLDAGGMLPREALGLSGRDFTVLLARHIRIKVQRRAASPRFGISNKALPALTRLVVRSACAMQRIE